MFDQWQTQADKKNEIVQRDCPDISNITMDRSLDLKQNLIDQLTAGNDIGFSGTL